MESDEAEETLPQFAAYLREHGTSITEQWMATVQRDSHIQRAADLTTDELRDEIPSFIRRISELMRAPSDPEKRTAAAEIARDYGHRRWKQGYRSDELLREMMHLREVFVGHSFGFEESTPSFTGMTRRAAMQRLNSFFGEYFGEAAEQFVRDQQAPAPNELGEEDHPARAGIVGLEQPAPELSRPPLLRTATHELRNLLNCAQLCVHALTEKADIPSRSDVVPMLTRSLRQMSEVLGDLLDLSVLAAGHRPATIGRLRPTEFAEELQLTFRGRAADKGLALTFECDPELHCVATDGTKLKQIAVNLLSNAIKYCDRGEVRFWLRGQDITMWTFGVEDTGPGFDAEVRAHLFDEFYRAKETADREGTGLGLPIVKRLVETLGGKMNIESQPGRGSRFEVVLPREYSAAQLDPMIELA